MVGLQAGLKKDPPRRRVRNGAQKQRRHCMQKAKGKEDSPDDAKPTLLEGRPRAINLSNTLALPAQTGKRDSVVSDASSPHLRDASSWNSNASAANLFQTKLV